MIRIWVFLLLICLPAALLAQDKEPPERQLESVTSDTAKLTLLRTLAIRNRAVNMPLAMRYSREGISLARKAGNTVRLASFYSVLANNFISEYHYDSAVLYLDSAYRQFRQAGDRKGMAHALSGMGGVAQRRSDLVAAVRYFKEAYVLAEATGDRRGMFLSTYNTAVTYSDQQNGKLALEYALKAYRQVRADKDQEHLGMTLAALAEAYRLNRDTVHADQYFNMAQTVYKQDEDEYGLASVLTNWALIQRDPARELELQIQAQEYWDRSGTEDLMAIANLGNLGARYYELYLNDIYKGKYGDKPALLRKAASSLERSIAMAQQFGSTAYQPEPLKTLAMVRFAQGNYKEAYRYLEQATQLNETVFSQENKNKIAALESRQKIALRDREIRLTRMALAAERKQQVFLLAGILLLLAAGALFYFQANARKKANRELQRLNTELDEANRLKASLFGILSHDLRSPVARLVSFLRLQKEAPELLNEEMKIQYEGRIRTSAENLLDTMESVLAWSKGQMENFTPKPEKVTVASLFDYLKRHFDGVHELNMIFRDPEQTVLDTDPEFLKTIMRNFTDNAAKAVKYTTEPLICWSAGRAEGKPFLEIADNGPGAGTGQLKALFDDKAEVVARNGLGFHLVRDLAKAIRCRIEVTTKEGVGTTFRILFA